MEGKFVPFGHVELTEEEEKQLIIDINSEGFYRGNDPEVIKKIEKEMAEDEEFQKFLKEVEKEEK